MSAQSIQSIKDQMAAMEQSLSQLRRALDTLSPSATAEPIKPVKGKKAEPSADKAEPKAPSAWNVLVAQTVADMRQNGWESWTDAKGTVWPASRRGPVKDKSGGQSEGFVYDGGENDGKAPSPALGGMVRASYIKASADPEAAAKAAAYKAALDAKRSAAPSAAAPAAEPKKAGRPPMTAEQKAAAAVKRAEKKAESGSESAEAEPKKAGRPKMTEEQKAAAAVKRAAKKAAAGAAAPPSDAESVKSCSSGVPAGWAELLGETIAPNKKVDLSFYPFVYKGKDLLMNDRGDVVDPEDGTWAGRLVNGLIDESVAEPADLEDVTMRE